MKIVILTSRFPYPLEKGDKLRIYHQIKELSQKHDITLIALCEQIVENTYIRHMQQYCEHIYLFPLQKWRIAFNLIRGFFNRLPLQVAYFYSPYLKRLILQAIQEAKPDHLYCQLIRMAPYVEALKVPKTLDFMDAFSAGMQRRANRARGLSRLIFNVEAKRLRRYENQVLLKFDYCTIISEQDRNLLRLSHNKNVKIIPNGVDTQFFNSIKNYKKEYHIAFVGNMGYHPNVKAAKYLVNEILPILQEKIPDIKILIAGARPSAEVRNLQSEQVVVTGWIDDIRDAYGSAQVFVAPIFFGSGQQNKILEAMSMGLPCITTSMVNNAIGAPVEKGIYVADNADSFATQILQLLQNPDLRSKIGQASRAFVEQNYSWQHSVSILAELFEKNSQQDEF